MIELNDVSPDKKQFIDTYLKTKHNGAAELSFANLCMWRKSFKLKYTVLEDVLCFSALYSPKGKKCFSFPAGFTDSTGQEISDDCLKGVICKITDYFKTQTDFDALRFCDINHVNRLTEVFPDTFEIYEDRDSFDYVYNVQDLINLSGKKYHSKKNHVNKFRKLYPDFKYCTLSSADTDECLALFNKWRNNKEEETFGLDDEYIAIKELMTNLEKLDTSAAGIRIDNELVAFSCGEALDDKTVLIHLEHANTACEGAFAAMNQQFLENRWSNYEFVNREEDMGIPGMRRAKESYRPVTMIKKYIAKIK